MPHQAPDYSPILPAFLRYPDEAAILGRLVAGYGELEYELGECLAVTTVDSDAARRDLFLVRGAKPPRKTPK